jgi:hypothetical protein
MPSNPNGTLAQSSSGAILGRPWRRFPHYTYRAHHTFSPVLNSLSAFVASKTQRRKQSVQRTNRTKTSWWYRKEGHFGTKEIAVSNDISMLTAIQETWAQYLHTLKYVQPANIYHILNVVYGSWRTNTLFLGFPYLSKTDRQIPHHGITCLNDFPSKKLAYPPLWVNPEYHYWAAEDRWKQPQETTFGRYYEVYCGTDNTNRSDALVVCLRPSNNQGGYYFMNIQTARRSGIRFTELSVPQLSLTKYTTWRDAKCAGPWRDGCPLFEWNRAPVNMRTKRSHVSCARGTRRRIWRRRQHRWR